MKTLDDLDVAGKKVLLRSDLNVPLDGDRITDDGRIRASVPTINTLLDRGARVIIAAHLGRLEEELGRTQRAVASLRDLLTPAETAAIPDITLRELPSTGAAAITETVAMTDGAAWMQGALGELYATVAGQGLAQTGPAGGLFSEPVFTEHHGEATIFVPCDGPVRPLGRVRPTTVPAAEFAVIEHAGPPIESDRAYGALAAYVERHALAVQGPIREYYLVGQRDTADVAQWRTEVCWPVFRVGSV